MTILSLSGQMAGESLFFKERKDSENSYPAEGHDSAFSGRYQRNVVREIRPETRSREP